MCTQHVSKLGPRLMWTHAQGKQHAIVRVAMQRKAQAMDTRQQAPALRSELFGQRLKFRVFSCRAK